MAEQNGTMGGAGAMPFAMSSLGATSLAVVETIEGASIQIDSPSLTAMVALDAGVCRKLGERLIEIGRAHAARASDTAAAARSIERGAGDHGAAPFPFTDHRTLAQAQREDSRA